MYQEDLKLENYAISVAHPPPGDRSELCPVGDIFTAPSERSLHPSNTFFLLKSFCEQTRKEACNSTYVQAAWWATLPWKQLELILSALSALPSWNHVKIMCVKTSPLAPVTWRWKNWLQYSWAPDWVVQGQFCSTNVLADDSEVWPWLWHVTCTLETTFLLKKKMCESLYTVTCQDNNLLRRKFRAGFPLLALQPPLQPVRQGGFR